MISDLAAVVHCRIHRFAVCATVSKWTRTFQKTLPLSGSALIKLTQAAAGHTSADMTLKYYVKGREDIANATAAVGRVYTA